MVIVAYLLFPIVSQATRRMDGWTDKQTDKPTSYIHGSVRVFVHPTFFIDILIIIPHYYFSWEIDKKQHLQDMVSVSTSH